VTSFPRTRVVGGHERWSRRVERRALSQVNSRGRVARRPVKVRWRPRALARVAKMRAPGPRETDTSKRGRETPVLPWRADPSQMPAELADGLGVESLPRASKQAPVSPCRPTADPTTSGRAIPPASCRRCGNYLSRSGFSASRPNAAETSAVSSGFIVCATRAASMPILSWGRSG
jgi:hypothetical protein